MPALWCRKRRFLACKMRKTLFLILLLAALPTLLAGCKSANEAPASRIETGDLLFVGIPMNYGDEGMAQAIADATSDGSPVNFIHTAILEVDAQGKVWVIDATIAHGVDRHPLDTLLKDFALHREGAHETLEVMRLRDNGDAVRFVEQAKAMLGDEYDLYFKQSNGRHYCTELVYDTYVDADGNHLFESVPMNFLNKEGEMPPYWTKLFAMLGEEVPQGAPGTNPQMMRASDKLIHVCFLEP